MGVWNNIRCFPSKVQNIKWAQAFKWGSTFPLPHMVEEVCSMSGSCGEPLAFGTVRKGRAEKLQA